MHISPSADVLREQFLALMVDVVVDFVGNCDNDLVTRVDLIPVSPGNVAEELSASAGSFVHDRVGDTGYHYSFGNVYVDVPVCDDPRTVVLHGR